MSGYTSGNKAPTQMTQSPNRKGNQSKHTPTGMGGVTAMTRSMGGLAQPKGSQGAPKTGCDPTYGSGQKVMVNYAKQENYKSTNTAYLGSDRTNYLK